MDLLRCLKTIPLLGICITLISFSVWFFGDPHFLTLDGKNYTFNGVGEYTMVTANYSAFVLQARTKVAQGGLNTATVFSAGVAKEDNTSKVEVRIKSGGMNCDHQ